MIEYAEVPVADLQPYGLNPRQGDIGAISVSLQSNGQYRPIVVNKADNTILAGNHTYHAAVSLGWEKIQVGYVDVDEATAQRIVLVDNRTNDLADYDRNVLADLLELVYSESGPEGLVGTGFELEDYDEALAVASKSSPWDDRKMQETAAAEDVKVGTIWQVGPHVLGCGDSRDPTWWDRLLDGRTPALMFTDPPYGIDYSGGGVEREALTGDSADEALPLLQGVLDAVIPAMSPGAATYVCLSPGDKAPPLIAELFSRDLYRWLLIWVKDNATFGRADYHQQHEIIVYGWKKGPHHAVQDRSETSVWNVPRPSDSDLHPTSKPVELPGRAIRNSTRPGALVIDPFAGSGSTLVAAERENRVAVGNEIDPGYVNMALSWLETETGAARQRVL